MNRRRILTVLLAAVVLALPVWAVFKETSLPRTLKVLHYELKNTLKGLQDNSQTIEAYEKAQHKTLVELMENCNELSLMLYSQQQDFTFDLTYALEEVSNQYLEFNTSRMPYNEIATNLEIEIDRYYKLVQTLMNLPPALKDDDVEKESEAVQDTSSAQAAPVLSDEQRDSLLAVPRDSVMVNDSILLSVPSFMDSEENPYLLTGEGKALRDSCVYYANQIIDIYWERLFLIDENFSYYQEADVHLREAYNYAQQRYDQVQKNVFLKGQRDYLSIIRHFPRYVERAIQDCRTKYSTTANKSRITSEWRGPMVLGFLVMILFYIVLAIGLSSLLVRVLLRRIPFFKSDFFVQRKFLFTVLAGLVIFAITIMIVNITTEASFVNMALPLVAEFAWLSAAIFTSILIRMGGTQAKHAVAAYLPIIVMGLTIISFRIIFIPNSLINIIFPPILLTVLLWQLTVNARFSRELQNSDKTYLWISAAIMLISTVVACLGYVLIALLVVIWWTFQLTLIQTITAVFDLLTRYYDSRVKIRKKEYMKDNPGMPFSGKGSFIEVSWLYDLLKACFVPLLAIWSIPLCLYMAGGVFDFSTVMMDLFYKPIINIEKVINLSLFKVAVVVSLIYLFSYISYAAKSLYRVWRTRAAISKLREGVVFKETNINFTLADNIISLVTWGSFIVIAFVLLQIPATAITIITTGLATGIGFAMKDVLNNFFYGVQLMSGRLRVGDVIECDGIRGTVDSMSYQSTQILAGDGSIIAFPNSSLFSKNFKNLTRNNSYQLLKIPVGVKYGSDVEKVRSLIIDALEHLRVRDKYDRDVVDPKFGIEVRFEGFGDSSVDLTVLQKVTVDAYYTYGAKAKEIIYNTLNENNIEIPFPQRDLYIKEMPGK